jgi:hypothetical protein
MATCSGSLILHGDGTIAGCTNDDDGDCAGPDARHASEPKRCVDWWGSCNDCGVHLDG